MYVPCIDIHPPATPWRLDPQTVGNVCRTRSVSVAVGYPEVTLISTDLNLTSVQYTQLNWRVECCNDNEVIKLDTDDSRKNVTRQD